MKVVIFEKAYKTLMNRQYNPGDKVPARNFVSELLSKLEKDNIVKVEDKQPVVSEKKPNIKEEKAKPVKVGRPKKT